MTHSQRKQQILEEAQARGLRTKDLKVLTTDPYLVGSEGEYNNAKWAADLWDTMMASRQKPIHIRGFHYWVQSRRVKKPNGKIYGDDPDKDWRWLQDACKIARYLGIGEWEGLIDMKHPNPQDYDTYDCDTGLYVSDSTVQDVIREDLRNMIDTLMDRARWLAPRYKAEGYQTYHTEVWCEKSSMGFIIEPVCRRNRATYQPLVGQSSVEKVEMLARRVIQAAEAGKKVRIWYIADWDRYGWSMVTAVARKLEYVMIDKGIEADVRLTRLALNEDQIKKYKLPKAPKKGEAVVELDALEAIYPGELAKIIRNALNPYVDSKNPRIIDEENTRMEDKLREILEETLRPALEKALTDVSLDDVDVNLEDCVDPDFRAPERDHEVSEDDSWVFDSSRDWFDQLERFQQYKDEREEEAA